LVGKGLLCGAVPLFLSFLWSINLSSQSKGLVVLANIWRFEIKKQLAAGRRHFESSICIMVIQVFWSVTYLCRSESRFVICDGLHVHGQTDGINVECAVRIEFFPRIISFLSYCRSPACGKLF
jgi:hypothetical protein